MIALQKSISDVVISACRHMSVDIYLGGRSDVGESRCVRQRGGRRYGRGRSAAGAAEGRFRHLRCLGRCSRHALGARDGRRGRAREAGARAVQLRAAVGAVRVEEQLGRRVLAAHDQVEVAIAVQLQPRGVGTQSRLMEGPRFESRRRYVAEGDRARGLTAGRRVLTGAEAARAVTDEQRVVR